MKRNEDIQKDVQEALKWEPSLKAAEIGVTVKDGIVTLTGTVNNHAKKMEAEDAAKNVAGVKAVVEKIEVNFDIHNMANDSEIAKEIVKAFSWSWEIPENQIKMKVENGWITLEGTLEWNYQKEAIKKVMHSIVGIKGISNYISIESTSKDKIEKRDIELALIRNWTIDDKDILINVLGNKVTLSGTVHSLYQKDEAGRIAWKAPGVCAVDNQLLVV